MRCLWLALGDPDPPQNGQFIYSGGLIHAVAALGVELHVVAFSLPGGTHQDGEKTGNIVWHLAEGHPRAGWRAVFSALPRDVFRTRTSRLLRHVRGLLTQRSWDVVVFDSLTLGWALKSVRAACKTAPMGYLSHNHEEAVAGALAQDERDWLKRPVRHLDALKGGRMERETIRHADLITGN